MIIYQLYRVTHQVVPKLFIQGLCNIHTCPESRVREQPVVSACTFIINEHRWLLYTICYKKRKPGLNQLNHATSHPKPNITLPFKTLTRCLLLTWCMTILVSAICSSSSRAFSFIASNSLTWGQFGIGRTDNHQEGSDSGAMKPNESDTIL